MAVVLVLVLAESLRQAHQTGGRGRKQQQEQPALVLVLVLALQ